MIFCIDIGNSNIKYAIFDGDEMKASFRVTSQPIIKKYITDVPL